MTIMVAFQLGSLLGICIGAAVMYGIGLVLYRWALHTGAEQERLAEEYRRTHPPQPQPQPQMPETPVDPPSVAGDGRTLAEQWNLPRNRELGSQELLRTPRCPTGYSAAQILGYRDLGGRRHKSLYPGGKWAFLPDDEEEETDAR